MSAHLFVPSGREPLDRCARCGCAEAEAVHDGARCPACQRLVSMLTAPCPQCSDYAPGRLIRLDELDSLSSALLLAYLDGRAPELVDEWFADRERRKAAAAASTGG